MSSGSMRNFISLPVRERTLWGDHMLVGVVEGEGDEVVEGERDGETDLIWKPESVFMPDIL